jgi:site-specific DNA-methyltransferase (adenine-specific)
MRKTFFAKEIPDHLQEFFAPVGGGEGWRLPDVISTPPETVKSTALMRWLCRLITPPGGTVIDPFMGSGSTGKAAILEGFSFIGFELHNEYPDLAYFDIAKARIAWAVKEYARLEKERANQPRSLFDNLEGV